ncbi:ATPase, T2SS/T4P/T4SS family [Vibrio agarivorans]|uniref:ATPase, T2SS/T4P/T4SS family n=1 Tax=Vibrio agarivorans TaxID=153622 RepID=UPI0025B59DF4|nr:ATPase, T2SS/T4P/T4SS family [Vibrio agarivorans]MDN3661079.1 ATPase, T2SS/T4P/T4SS family [Vibrio agarivorans]
MSSLELSYLIKSYGSHELKSTGAPQVSDNWLMTPSPIIVSMIDANALDVILIKAVEAKYRDIYIASDNYIRGRKGNKFQLITNRELTHSEVETLMDSMTGNKVGRAYGGESINDRYIVTDRLNPNKKTAFRYSLTTHTNGNFRGLDVAIRPIPEDVPKASDIGIEGELLDHVESMTQGMILLIGGTGTGKTTTLAAIMRYILEKPSHTRILEYGRPPEYMWHNVLIHPSNEIITYSVAESGESGGDAKDYEQAISTAVRKAPTWVAVTEMTDLESFKAGIEFSNTGHIVSSTLHANSVESAFSRIYMKFPSSEREALMDNLISETEIMVAQKLEDRVGGEMIAVREQLILTTEVKDTLKDAMENGLTALKRSVRHLLEIQQTSFKQAAANLYEQGLIDEATLSKYMR